MKRKLRTAALMALAFGLAACDDPAPLEHSGSAAPATPPAPPPAQAAGLPKPSAQAQLEADMALSGKVKAAVDQQARSHIEVAANDGVVTLYGTVDAPADKDRIALDAMGVEGVRSVVNNLVVLRGS